MTLRLSEILHGHAGAAQVSHADKNVDASQTKYAHISGIKIDENIKILKPIDMIKRHGVLC